MSFDARFRYPCNILLTGPTQVNKNHVKFQIKPILYHPLFFQSGKSTFIEKLLKWKELLFQSIPKKVIYIYATRSPSLDMLLQKDLIHKAVKNLPSTFEALEKLVAPFYNDGALLVIDDGLSQMESYLPTLFEEFTSKRNTSIIFVSQATFLDDSKYRRLSDNSHYIICLRNKRNPSKIRSLAHQAKPCNPQFVVNSYIDATKPKPLRNGKNDYGYGYFVFDFSLLSPEILNFRTNIFPNEIEPITVYQERD